MNPKRIIKYVSKFFKWEVGVNLRRHMRNGVRHYPSPTTHVGETLTSELRLTLSLFVRDGDEDNYVPPLLTVLRWSVRIFPSHTHHPLPYGGDTSTSHPYQFVRLCATETSWVTRPPSYTEEETQTDIISPISCLSKPRHPGNIRIRNRSLFSGKNSEKFQTRTTLKVHI